MILINENENKNFCSLKKAFNSLKKLSLTRSTVKSTCELFFQIQKKNYFFLIRNQATGKSSRNFFRFCTNRDFIFLTEEKVSKIKKFKETKKK
jgi:hypothetical protein